MLKYKTHVYIIRCLTNLHAGSGDSNYGAIDKLVQRDQINGYPEIHSSGVKGAIREYFEHEVTGLSDKQAFFKYVFGSIDKKATSGSQQGAFRFISNATLISIPVRSNYRPFYRASTPLIIKDFEEKCKKLGANLGTLNDLLSLSFDSNKPYLFEDTPNIKLEDISANPLPKEIITSKQTAISNVANILGENIAICNDEEHMRQFTKRLPVIARNHLENGESKNLWYEEIVPRETRFCVLISIPNDELGSTYFKEFNNNVNGKIIQIGANASIGYGCCEFTLISKNDLL